MERRKLLALMGSSAAVGLAGCSGGGGDNGDDNGNGNGNNSNGDENGDENGSQNGEEQDPANFSISLGTVAEVNAGEDATIPYTVENTGEQTGTQDIVLTVGETEVDSTSVELDGGASHDGEFTYTTSEEDTPSVTVTVSSDDDDATGSITVIAQNTGTLDGQFSATSTGGFISIGETDEEAARESGFSMPPTDEVTDPIVVEGEINDEEGTWSSTTVDFPALDPDALVGDIGIDLSSLDVIVTAPEGFSGTIEQEDEPLMTVEGPLNIEVQSDGSYMFDVSITLAATTGTSGGLEGEFDTETLTTTVVDNETAVDAVDIDSVLASTINDELGLPAEEGEFWLELDFSLENAEGEGSE